jgi:multiple sugar transport system substrate-binding protein
MTTKPCLLRGITWNHSRAFPPLLATAQRFEELHPHVSIQWQKRSLHAFGHANVSELAESFDLVVMDHPWCGYAVDHRVFVNLRDCVDDGFLNELRRQSVGSSFASYEYKDQLVALPIDAAAPAVSFRADLIAPEDIPENWDGLIELAGAGRVVLSGFHVDLLLHLVMLAVTLDNRVFLSEGEWVEPVTCRRAMDMLRQLVLRVPKECLDWNPIAVYEAMSRTDDFVYCPFAYTYSNYARRGFAPKTLRFADQVEIPGCGMLRSVLGGTGIALSAKSLHRDQAIAYMVYLASGEIQKGIYLESGGQPAYRAAWLDDRANILTGEFFRSTLRSMDNTYVRPRYNGYLHFQENAGRPLAAWLKGEIETDRTIEEMNRIYRQSLSLDATSSQHN